MAKGQQRPFRQKAKRTSDLLKQARQQKCERSRLAPSTKELLLTGNKPGIKKRLRPQELRHRTRQQKCELERLGVDHWSI
ncbi:hypothetical protein D3H64_05650 [Atopobacter sp. AH10]|nr:hypothetical protein D3H64_05650 [Atopobacter sp. AH10]